MTLTWLPVVLRGAGLHVIELAGWRDRRTRDGFDPQGVVCHHTATGPGWADADVRNLLRDGRPDLKGPLSQLGLERDGTFVVVAGGRCNHNGYGQWGNDSIGIEAYNDGKGEPWPDVQIDAFVRGVRAICVHQGWGPSRVLAHRETDPSRKIDPTGIDMDWFRAQLFGGGFLMALSDKDQRDLKKKVDLIFERGFGLAPQDNIPEGDRGLIERRVSRLFLALGDIQRDLDAIKAKLP